MGKRSGDGFVAHKGALTEALQRTTADRVTVCGATVGRRGLLNYLKALGGSNIVKVIPTNNKKSLKVLCGSHIGKLNDGEWIGEKTPVTLAELRVSPATGVKPNVGATEIAFALSTVIPFTKKLDKESSARPVLSCVLFEAKQGVLSIVASDGTGLAVNSFAFDEQEAKALVSREEIRAIVNALRRAKRVQVRFDGKGDDGYANALVFATDLVQYRLECGNYRYPDWRPLFPDKSTAQAHIDTVETGKAINALKALQEAKDYSIDLVIADGKVTLSSPDDNGQAEVSADTEGNLDIRLDGIYIANALRLCGGMVDIMGTKPYEPLTIKANGYQVCVMPLLSDKANKAMVADREAKEKQAEKQPVASQPKEVKASKVPATASK